MTQEQALHHQCEERSYQEAIKAKTDVINQLAHDAESLQRKMIKIHRNAEKNGFNKSNDDIITESQKRVQRLEENCSLAQQLLEKNLAEFEKAK